METEKIFELIKDLYENSVMFDVGAHVGSTLKPFLLNNWNVYAFEPNPNMYKKIESFIKNNSDFANNLKLEKKCVNDIEQENLTFYLSEVSNGISSLTPFHNSHKKAPFTVSSIRLDNYMKTNNINHVNFLKIDTEGHDYNVLKSYPWHKDKPDVIECEFEDYKSVNKLNYNWKDMAEYLNKLNYKIIISEWYPITKYGGNHKWKGFKEYPCELDDKNGWGNFICFQDIKLYNKFKSYHRSHLLETNFNYKKLIIILLIISLLIILYYLYKKKINYYV